MKKMMFCMAIGVGMFLTGCSTVMIGNPSPEPKKPEVKRIENVNHKPYPQVVIHYHVIVTPKAYGFDPRYIPNKNVKKTPMNDCNKPCNQKEVKKTPCPPPPPEKK